MKNLREPVGRILSRGGVVRFTIAAAAGAIIDYIVGFCLIQVGVAPIIALVAGLICGLLLLHTLHENWTFTKGDTRKRSGRLGKLIVASGIVLLTRWLTLKALGYPLFGWTPPVAFALGVAFVTSFTVNYLASRFLIYRSADRLK